ncbi:uncharacterized protein LOC135487112 [Lineus longissimus]|uniref:uncharacterized protein LOC135487112 n=1 Tax=Lineus longissimus TaxID=88925 RepID=UPI002B4DF179
MGGICIIWRYGASLAFSLISILHPAQSSCPETSRNTLNWTKPMGDTLYECANQLKSIWCCAEGYSQITWSRWIWGASTWDDYPWADTITYMDSGDQHLYFKKVSLRDQGQYRCVVSSNTDELPISHQYDLLVDDCSVCGGRPKIGKPTESQEINYHYVGSDFSTNCLASFGPANCSDPFGESLNTLQWFKAYNRTYCADKQIGPQGKKRPYDPKVPFKLYEAFLNVTNVTEADFGMYCCRAYDGFSQVDRMIELKAGPAPKATTDDRILETSVEVIGPIVGVSVVLLFTLWFFRLDILLFCHTFNGHRSIPDAQYDVMLINSGSQRDSGFVERILMPHLEGELQFDVFLPRRDLDIGYIDGAYIDALRDSRKIIIVLTEDFLTNPLCGHIHNYIISDNRNKDIIFIQRGNIQRTLWEENENITNIEVLRTSAKNAKRNLLCLGKYLTWRENFEMQSPLQNNITIINTNFSRQIARFWKQLCLHLPRSDGSVQMRFVRDQPSPSPNVV